MLNKFHVYNGNNNKSEACERKKDNRSNNASKNKIITIIKKKIKTILLQTQDDNFIILDKAKNSKKTLIKNGDNVYINIYEYEDFEYI